jgi:hypothetical protein
MQSNETTPPADTRHKSNGIAMVRSVVKWPRIGVALAGAAFCWCLVTTPTILGPVRLYFEWERGRGFTYMRSEGRIASLFAKSDHRYLLTNPVVVMQAKAQLRPMFDTHQIQYARGRLEFNVALSFLVLGLHGGDGGEIDQRLIGDPAHVRTTGPTIAPKRSL